MAKMLIVDDSAAEREHLRALLTRAGHVVVTAVSGAEALPLARAERPDLIFMDIVMDDMDGFRATRTLKEEEGTHQIPVVVVSSKNQKADKLWAQLQGAKAYVVKPYAAADIERAIEQVLGNS